MQLATLFDFITMDEYFEMENPEVVEGYSETE
jgi:hypothetical protein